MRIIAFIISGLLLLSGCVPALVAVGIVTGYSIGNDSAMGNVRSEYRVLWDVCMDVLEDTEAEILMVKESRGTIKAKVSDYSVEIEINTLSSDSQRLKVSARRNFLPKPHMAQRIFLKIIESL